MPVKYFGKQEVGKQPSESAEMITFFNTLRKHYPELGAIAIHVRNEGKRSYQQTARQKLEGMVKGASDINIPGCPSFVCEMKSKAKNAKVSKEQKEYLESCDKMGAFACVAYGFDGAMEALTEWLDLQKSWINY